MQRQPAGAREQGDGLSASKAFCRASWWIGISDVGLGPRRRSARRLRCACNRRQGHRTGELVGGQVKSCWPSDGHQTLSRVVKCIVPCLHHAHRPSPVVLARPPSRAFTLHGCRVRACREVPAACPARVGGQGSAARPQINCSAPLSLAREQALAQGTNPPISRSASDACVASKRAQTPAALALK